MGGAGPHEVSIPKDTQLTIRNTDKLIVVQRSPAICMPFASDKCMKKTGWCRILVDRMDEIYRKPKSSLFPAETTSHESGTGTSCKDQSRPLS